MFRAPLLAVAVCLLAGPAAASRPMDPPTNEWGLFPSASIGWRLSEESFLRGGTFSDLKLRAGIARTGNQAFGWFCFTSHGFRMQVFFLIAGFFNHRDLPGLACFAAMHSPRRILDPVEHRLEIAVAEDFVSFAIAKAAAKSAGPARIFTQGELDNAIGIH